MQKTATILSGSETGIPGDVVEWTVRAQVSDYFDLDALRLSDLLSDGQSFDPSFAPTLLVREQGAIVATGAFAAANFDATRNGATTPVTFGSGTSLSRAAGQRARGRRRRGAAPTEVVIVFHSVVDTNYSNR